MSQIGKHEHTWSTDDQGGYAECTLEQHFGSHVGNNDEN